MAKNFQALAEAFTILAKYSDKSNALSAEHDVIYAQTKPDGLSDDDRKRLGELGWREDEEFDCMAMIT